MTTNKDKLLAIIHNYPFVMEEVNYFLGVYDDQEDYDIFDAFSDAEELAEEYASVSADKKTWNEFKEIFIKIGYCIPVDISKVYVSSGKKYWFKYKGIAYDCVSGWEQFINE